MVVIATPERGRGREEMQKRVALIKSSDATDRLVWSVFLIGQVVDAVAFWLLVVESQALAPRLLFIRNKQLDYREHSEDNIRSSISAAKHGLVNYCSS